MIPNIVATHGDNEIRIETAGMTLTEYVETMTDLINKGYTVTASY